MIDFNDAYIIVDKERNILVMRKLGPLPEEFKNDKSLSFIEKQELRPVEMVLLEEKLNLTEEGKKRLILLKKAVIEEDAGSKIDEPGRYYLKPERIEALKAIIKEFSIKS
ncbi:MAG: hypothetical protein LWW95_01940 [Candidatus Desulfofervidus auxilii]|nr:hypothetical protein [Candidatus Desulfofervidus auxilii]